MPLLANKPMYMRRGMGWWDVGGYSMLSFQIEWSRVHWWAAKPTHLATLMLSCNPVILLFPCHRRSLLCPPPQLHDSLCFSHLPPPSLSIVLILIHALASPRLLHGFQLLAASLNSARVCDTQSAEKRRYKEYIVTHISKDFRITEPLVSWSLGRSLFVKLQFSLSKF